MSQEDGSWEDVKGGCTPPVPSSGATRIVKRIADALGLSPAVLYDAPAFGDAPSGIEADAVIADSGLDCACTTLLNAYPAIRRSEGGFWPWCKRQRSRPEVAYPVQPAGARRSASFSHPLRYVGVLPK